MLCKEIIIKIFILYILQPLIFLGIIFLSTPSNIESFFNYLLKAHPEISGRDFNDIQFLNKQFIY